METNTQWLTAMVALPVPIFRSWNIPTLVRTNGNVFQVKVEETILTPNNDTPEDFIREIKSVTDGLIEPRLGFTEGSHAYDSTLTVNGWREPSDAEMAVIVQHDF